MIHPHLINPSSIVVIGASENLQSPGGKVLYNILSHGYKGKLYGVNPKLKEVQGVPCYTDVSHVPNVELAIIAVAAKFCVDIVRTLATAKNTKGYIILSAGFGEQDEKGVAMEQEIVKIIETHGGSLLGPNNIGLMNTHYAGVFTTPIPVLDAQGVDFISGSGATAVFIIEAAMSKGLRFNSVYSVGNSAQIGVEEVLEYLDESYKHGVSAPVKLLYIESIQNPNKLLKHARSLREKGAKLAAIKAGSSDAGSRAASSHTGAIANSDTAVDALFHKAGIIRCFGREDLIETAGVLTYRIPNGKNIGIITHAGGPAVMLTDVLSKNGLNVPPISSPKAQDLVNQLFPGSSVANPIDFLATGTAEQLDTILTYCENEFDELDALVVIFGSPGLFKVDEVYQVLHQHILKSKKTIYPILPSVVNVARETQDFIAQGHFAFTDEVLFGNALGKVNQSVLFPLTKAKINADLRNKLLNIVQEKKGYLSPEKVRQLLQTVGIPVAEEYVINYLKDLDKISLTYPVVAKVIGPVHKTDVNGVKLDIPDLKTLQQVFTQLIQIPQATGVLVQPMYRGVELFVGAKAESNFGHTVLCGMGGTAIEVWKDIQIGLAPLHSAEIEHMIAKLKAYPLLKGIRGQEGINLNAFQEVVEKVSQLVTHLPEIAELDLNPLLADENGLIAVDARIRIEAHHI
jgi:acetyltransferase